jgi:hypothetical protein
MGVIMLFQRFSGVAWAVLITALISGCSKEAPEPVIETVELFNGKDLSGWTRRGGEATYDVEDGEIVGRSKPDTPNTFLATDKEYGDFILELEFKIDDPEFNSGIQIRSHARSEGEGEEARERVYGYQVEIDPREDRKWTAGLYFEGGSPAREAGWLDDLDDNEAAREAFELGVWNQLRVVANGRRIQTWLNGVEAADFTDEDDAAFTPRGFIALQVHSVGGAEEPKEVRWRNIRITELNGSEIP